MEELLHYVWKHKILPLRELKTTEGSTIEVLNPGIHNTDAGPDFHAAKIKIDGVVWVGDVEIHVHTSDWFRHGHDKAPNYDNIILHVAADIDCDLKYPDGNNIPQLQIEVPQYVRTNYDTLLLNDHTPRCANIINSISPLMIHSWLNSLQAERFEVRMKQIMDRREALNKSWEDALFVTIARNFGFGKNGDAFELWANSIPMGSVAKHRDNLFQIEAIFFGQAGLLNDNDNLNLNDNENSLEPTNLQTQKLKNLQTQKLTNSKNDYYSRLSKEYRYLRQKFSLTPIDPKAWKFLRLRPQNFPHVRIAQLAMLYYKQQFNMSRLINADSIEKIETLFNTQVSDFWKTHYSFTSTPSASSDKQLSKSSIHLIIINSVAPFLFAYGSYKSDDTLREQAFELWESLKPESNSIIRNWKTAGLIPEHAGDTQALIQLTKNYCDRHDCLRCRFGYEFIRKTPDFLREKNEDNT